MKKHSTGSLSKEDHELQDKIYAQNNRYDFIIIGSGLAGLSVGCLLANAGKKVCMLEAHDQPGGYAHSFKMGDYDFCAQIHYVWGCGPGEPINEFLKKLDLEKDITFSCFDPEGYDQMVMPDGKRVKIPYGYDKLVENIEKAFPGQKKPMEKFTAILEKIQSQVQQLPNSNIGPWKFITKSPKFWGLIKYRNSTLQDVFDKCDLSKEAQAVLIAQAGDFMIPPERLSIFAYVGLFGGYNAGAYYPTKHFRYVTQRLARCITDNPGCNIFYETEVNKINIEDDKVTSVETKDGKKFTADTFICNMDPQKASYMIGRDKFPKKYLKRLSYEYSDSGLIIYLGLKDIDLREHGFGSFNTWSLEQWDMNKTWKELTDMNFDNPWIFLATPTLHTDQQDTVPEGGQILEIETFCPYGPLKEAMDRSYNEYNKIKQKIAEHMIDIVEKRYIPDLRKHIVVKVVGTPITNEDFCLAPKGNAYGPSLTPKNMGLKRLKAKTPWKNFFWCNATSGYAGFYGTIKTGMSLYMDLSGDRFFDKTQSRITLKSQEEP